jgi:hypothetical protein
MNRPNSTIRFLILYIYICRVGESRARIVSERCRQCVSANAKHGGGGGGGGAQMERPTRSMHGAEVVSVGRRDLEWPRMERGNQMSACGALFTYENVEIR